MEWIQFESVVDGTAVLVPGVELAFGLYAEFALCRRGNYVQSLTAHGKFTL